MTNADTDPARPVRDLAAINDSVELAEQARRDRAAEDMEVYSLDWIVLLPPALYLVTLVRWKEDLSIFAYGFWALTTLFWTPWLIFRVDNRRPPGDTARATAFLGYALLGWPLSALAIELVPVKWEFFVAFPIVFLWSVAFAAKGVWPRPPTPASRRRALMLTGGVLAYLACALLLGGAVLFLALRERAKLGDVAPLVLGATSVAALLCAIPGVCLVPVTWRTWRKAAAPSAAAP